MAATKQSQVVIEVEREQEKKHSWRYKELGDSPVLGTLYIQKHQLAEMDPPFPETLRVTIEPVA